MKIAGVEAELDRIADASETNKAGDITPLQIEAAAKIAIESSNYTFDLLSQLDRLCLEYNSLRKTMPAGAIRTQAMTRIVVKMRALAPALVEHINVYKGSGDSGSRLAAVAMMQMNPHICDIHWLSDRFGNDQPFIFYHSALALQNLANSNLSDEERVRLLNAANHGLEAVKKFDGVPDQGTIEVLEHIIADLQH